VAHQTSARIQLPRHGATHSVPLSRWPGEQELSRDALKRISRQRTHWPRMAKAAPLGEAGAGHAWLRCMRTPPHPPHFVRRALPPAGEAKVRGLPPGSRQPYRSARTACKRHRPSRHIVMAQVSAVLRLLIHGPVAARESLA